MSKSGRNHLESPIRLRAFLACQPEARFSTEEIYRGIGGSAVLMSRIFRRLLDEGLISSEKRGPRKAVYYVTAKQAEKIRNELNAIAGEVAFWQAGHAPAIVTPRAPVMAIAPAPAPEKLLPSKPQKIGVYDPMAAVNRLSYLRRIRDKSIFGEDAMLKQIIADYEHTLAGLTNRAAAA